MRRKSLGKYGESLACDFLENLGYQILHRNWRYGRYGEIDIIAYNQDQSLLTFVEVKTRGSNRYGTAIESISLSQQARIRRLAEAYIATVAETYNYQSVSFDVITVISVDNGYLPPTLEHIQSAF